jgi:hypothetical protein
MINCFQLLLSVSTCAATLGEASGAADFPPKAKVGLALCADLTTLSHIIGT